MSIAKILADSPRLKIKVCRPMRACRFAVAGFTPAAYRPRSLDDPRGRPKLTEGFALRCALSLSWPSLAPLLFCWRNIRQTADIEKFLRQCESLEGISLLSPNYRSP